MALCASPLWFIPPVIDATLRLSKVEDLFRAQIFYSKFLIYFNLICFFTAFLFKTWNFLIIQCIHLDVIIIILCMNYFNCIIIIIISNNNNNTHDYKYIIIIQLKIMHNYYYYYYIHIINNNNNMVIIIIGPMGPK